MDDTSLKAAEATWDNFDLDLARRVAWMSFRPIAETGQLTLPGAMNLTMYLHSSLKERLEATGYGRSAEPLRGCALVCGDMNAERHFFQLKDYVSFKSVDGFDLSSESLKKVSMEGVEFVAHHADCNELTLPVASYDLIVGHQGLHHVHALERLFEQAHRALKSTGFLFVSEWIGPNYLQIPRSNKIVSLLLLYLLFPGRKLRTNHMGHTKGLGFLQYGKEVFDPSEACNSDKLESELLKRFRYHKHVHFGGLCYPMFEGNAIHLNEKDPWILRRVRWVIAVEKLLTRLKLIRPLFLVAVCERR